MSDGSASPAMDCIFCKIASGKIKSDIVFENDTVVAFKDIAPQAPQHILIIPRKHVDKIEESSPDLLGKLLSAAAKIAELSGIKEAGYRVVINQGEAAGQAVPHLHLHILGGRRLHWPPG